MINVMNGLSFVPSQLGMIRRQGALGFGGKSFPPIQQVLQAKESKRQIELGTPAMVRTIGMNLLASAWPDFCSLIRRFGMVLQSPVSDLESLAPVSVPLRLAQRLSDQPFDVRDLETADLFELSTRTRDAEWGWPLELGSPQRLSQFIRTVREAGGGNTPIGVELPVGADQGDVALCVEAGADFLTLHGNQLDHAAICSVVRTRETMGKVGAPNLCMLVDFPLSTISDVIKCIALGASVVNLDGLLKPLLAHERERLARPASRGIGGLAAVATHQQTPSLASMEARLSELCDALRRQMLLCGAGGLADFNRGCLRATDPSTAELLRVDMLGQ